LLSEKNQYDNKPSELNTPFFFYFLQTTTLKPTHLGTGLSTIFIYDGFEGGNGISEHLSKHKTPLEKTLKLIETSNAKIDDLMHSRQSTGIKTPLIQESRNFYPTI
jgi:hypothetical protein